MHSRLPTAIPDGPGHVDKLTGLMAVGTSHTTPSPSQASEDRVSAGETSSAPRTVDSQAWSWDRHVTGPRVRAAGPRHGAGVGVAGETPLPGMSLRCLQKRSATESESGMNKEVEEGGICCLTGTHISSRGHAAAGPGGLGWGFGLLGPAACRWQAGDLAASTAGGQFMRTPPPPPALLLRALNNTRGSQVPAQHLMASDKGSAHSSPATGSEDQGHTGRSRCRGGAPHPPQCEERLGAPTGLQRRHRCLPCSRVPGGGSSRESEGSRQDAVPVGGVCMGVCVGACSGDPRGGQWVAGTHPKPAF